MTNTPRTQTNSAEKTTPDSLKKSLHGNLYQLSLLTLVALKASRNKETVGEVKDFKLYSEAKEHEKFDDLVIDYGDSITFLQAKHSSKNKEYTKADFLKGYVDKNDASLAKYFDSWYKLKNSEYCKNKSNKFIFFTNRGVKNEGDFLESISNDDKIILEGIEGETLKFKSGGSRDEFINAILSHSQELENDPLSNMEIKDAENGDFKAAKKYLSDKLKDRQKEARDLNIDRKSRQSAKVLSWIKLILAKIKRESPDIENLGLGEIKKAYDSFKHNISITIKEGDKHLLACEVLDCSFDENAFKEKYKKLINEFLDALIIKVGQPDNLAKNIYEELRKQNDLTIGISDMQSYLHSKMFDWLADAKTTVLSMDSFGKMTEKKLGDLYRYYLLGATEDYKHLHEKGNENIRIADLKYPLENKLTIVKDEGGGGLEQRVYNSICRNNDNLKDAEWSFMDISSRYLQKLPDIAKGSQAQFIIINCRDTKLTHEQKGYITQFIQGEKSVILLTSADINISDQESKIYEIKGLTNDEIGDITGSNDCFYIGGRKYSFKNMMENHKGTGLDKAMRNFDSLQQMLEQKKPERNLALAALPYDVYVENNLKKGIPKYSFASFLTEHSLKYLIVKDKSKSDLRDELKKLKKLKKLEEKDDKVFFRFTEDVKDPDKNKIKLVDNVTGEEDDEYRFICTTVDGTKLPENSVVLEFQNDGTVKIIDKKSPKALPAAYSYDFESGEDISREDDSLVNCDLAIISAKAGLGKSSFCLNEVMQCEQEGEKTSSPLWVVRVNLPRIKVKKEKKINILDVLNEKITGQKWYEWQITALQNDMQNGNKKNGNKKNVRLFLDGFNEIKKEKNTDEEKNIKKINKWINKLLKKEGVSILVTTRPYATNKIVPSYCKQDHFRLNPYSEEQQKEYLREYVKAITGNIDKSILNKIITNIDQIIKEHSDNLRDILGIPLESYIFCEVLKDDIIKCATTGAGMNVSNIEGLSTIELYQRFMKVKLETFFIKHVFCDKEDKHKTLGQLELHNDSVISIRERLYTFSFLYREILMTYAYNQAFSSERQALYSAYYTDEIVEDIKEMGIATIEKREESGYNIVFHHETYQEYFAVLVIFKGLVLSNGENQEIKQKIEESRYNPKFRVIMQMLAQLSMFGDPLLPNYDTKEGFKVVWQALAENGDILGAAAGSLFMDCIKELPDDKINLLKEFAEQHQETWGKDLLIAINRKMDKKTTREESRAKFGSGINTHKEWQDDFIKRYKPFLAKNHKTILRYMIERFNASIKKIDMNEMQMEVDEDEFKKLLADSIKKLLTIFWCAYEQEYVVVKDGTKLKFIKEDSLEIEVKHHFFEEFFPKIINNIFAYKNQKESGAQSLFFTDGKFLWGEAPNQFIDSEIYREIRKKFLESVIDDKDDKEKFFDTYCDNNFENHIKIWKGLGLIKEKVAQKCADCLISLMNKCSDYPTLKIIIRSLAVIHEDLYENNLNNPEYDKAREAFEPCLKKIEFTEIIGNELQLKVGKADGRMEPQNLLLGFTSSAVHQKFIFEHLQNWNMEAIMRKPLQYYKEATLEKRKEIFSKVYEIIMQNEEHKHFKECAKHYNMYLEDDEDLKDKLSPINIEEPDVEMAEAEEEKEEESKKRKVSSSSCSSEMESKRRKDDDEDDNPSSEKGKGKKRSLSSAESAAAKKVKESDKSSGSTSGASGTKQSTLATVLNREIPHNFIYNSSVTINVGGGGRCKVTCIIQQNYFNTKMCNRQISV